MKNLLILFFMFSGLAFSQAQKSLVFSTKDGAIKGYDPVAYFTDGKPVKGLANIAYTWHDAVWHFASTRHRDLFAATPEKYAPQYGGWCAYGWSQGYPAKIDPDAWSIIDGKLYLNYSLGVRDDWDKRRAEYIQKADTNYQKARETAH
jgi:hypothetical protein